MNPATSSRAAMVARLAETWFHRPASPTRVVWSLTRKCNLRCGMCLTWQTRHEPRLLSVPQIERVLHDLPRLTWLDLTGGEIFVRPDAEQVFDAVAAAAPALTVLHFPTNGWFGDRVVDVATRFRQARPGVDVIITVSVDGPRDVHDRIRGRDGAYDRALRTFRGLQEAGVTAYVGTTLTADSEPHLDALRDALLQAIPGFDDRIWHWNWLQRSEQFFKNDAAYPALVPPRHRERLREQVARRGAPRSFVDVMELGFLLNLERHLDGEPTGVGCQSLRSTCFISPEGDLYPCHVWDRPLGNVVATPFADLWEAHATLEARREVERLACGGCFTPCEAYPALAGSPVAAAAGTIRGAVRHMAVAGRGRLFAAAASRTSAAAPAAEARPPHAATADTRPPDEAVPHG